jgi:hypothetical protein
LWIAVFAVWEFIPSRGLINYVPGLLGSVFFDSTAASVGLTPPHRRGSDHQGTDGVGTRRCVPQRSLGLRPSKPEGTPRKLLDVSRLHRLGWTHRIALRESIAATYEWFLAQQPELRRAASPRDR